MNRKLKVYLVIIRLPEILILICWIDSIDYLLFIFQFIRCLGLLDFLEILPILWKVMKRNPQGNPRHSCLCWWRHSCLCWWRHSCLCWWRHSCLCWWRHSCPCWWRHSCLSLCWWRHSFLYWWCISCLCIILSKNRASAARCKFFGMITNRMGSAYLKVTPYIRLVFECCLEILCYVKRQSLVLLKTNYANIHCTAIVTWRCRRNNIGCKIINVPSFVYTVVFWNQFKTPSIKCHSGSLGGKVLKN